MSVQNLIISAQNGDTAADSGDGRPRTGRRERLHPARSCRGESVSRDGRPSGKLLSPPSEQASRSRRGAKRPRSPPPAPDIPAARDKRRAPSDRARGVGLVRRGPSPKGRRGGSRGDGHGGAGGAVGRAFRGVPRRLFRCDPATELRRSPSSKSRPDAQPGLAPRAPALGGTCHAPPPTRTPARGRIPRHFGNLPL